MTFDRFDHTIAPGPLSVLIWQLSRLVTTKASQTRSGIVYSQMADALSSGVARRGKYLRVSPFTTAPEEISRRISPSGLENALATFEHARRHRLRAGEVGRKGDRIWSQQGQ